MFYWVLNSPLQRGSSISPSKLLTVSIHCFEGFWRQAEECLEPSLTFLQKHFTAKNRYLFSQKTSIIEVWQGPSDIPRGVLKSSLTAYWVRWRLRMQEIPSSNPPLVTGICDLNKSQARHHRSYYEDFKKFHKKCLWWSLQPYN